MDEQGIKRLLSKKPIAKLLLISLFLGLLLLYIAEKKDYIMALMCPVTLTDGEQGKAFLNDKSYLFGNLKNLPVYYIGYDTLLGYEEENGEVWGEQKIGSVYYLYINDKIVLCEFSSSSKHPKDVLYGRTRLCYVQPLNENPIMYEIQHDIVEDTRGTTDSIRITDFSSKVLHLMSLDEMRYKQGKVILTILVALILLKEWLKCLLLIINIRSCRSIRWAIKQYGALVKIYEKIAEKKALYYQRTYY